MQKVINALRANDGVATTGELSAHGVYRGELDIAVMYGLVHRIRKGVWCLPDTPAAVRAAFRVKGRLACVSALIHHGVIDDAGFGLHVSAPLGQASWHPVPPRPDVVRHWSRSRLEGDRIAVDSDTAWAQFALCLAVAGRDVRLRQTDSL